MTDPKMELFLDDYATAIERNLEEGTRESLKDEEAARSTLLRLYEEAVKSGRLIFPPRPTTGEPIDG